MYWLWYNYINGYKVVGEFNYVQYFLRVLLDHGIPEGQIIVVTLIAYSGGLKMISMRHPAVRIVCATVEDTISGEGEGSVGFGNFGDRYFGTEKEI